MGAADVLGVREFAADFEWLARDPEIAFVQRLDELQALGLATNPFNEDLGLMLYDVFYWKERGEGFRWLRENEIANMDSIEMPKRRPRRCTEEAARYAGRLVKPAAAFFHARVEHSRLNCHPERVRILTQTA